MKEEREVAHFMAQDGVSDSSYLSQAAQEAPMGEKTPTTVIWRVGNC